MRKKTGADDERKVQPASLSDTVAVVPYSSLLDWAVLATAEGPVINCKLLPG